MVEQAKGKIRYRKILFTVVIVALVVLGVGILVRKPEVKFPVTFPTPEGIPTPAEGVPPEGVPPEEVGPFICPRDYCEEEKTYGAGACPGWTGTKDCNTDADCPAEYRCDPGYKKCAYIRIYWQNCWDYPERGTSLADCEARKVAYTATCGVRG